jgi:hypothetical protein
VSPARQNVTACRDVFFGFLLGTVLSVSSVASFIKLNVARGRLSECALRVISDSLYSAAMATRRPQRVHCGIVVNVVNVVFASLLAAVGCERADTPPGNLLIDGGSGGAGSPGGGGSSGSAISCNPMQTGCLCIVGDSQPGQIDTCSPTSVAQNATERGACCTAQSLCACIRYTCRSHPESSFCQCGSVDSLASVTVGAAVAECPAPTGGQKCCFSQDNATCICSGLGCDGEETEVPSCSAAAAGKCRSGEEITACR